jgi:hypothetical protein
MGKRIGDLRFRLDVAREVADRADSLHRDSLIAANQVELDTTQVGPLRIAHLPGQRELAEEVFGEVWSTYSALMAGSESLLDDQIFVFRFGWSLEGMYVDGPHVRKVDLSRRFGRSRLLEKAGDEVGRAIMSALPPDSSRVRSWMGSLPLTSVRDWEWIYRNLASTPALAAKRCYRGEVRWCWEAMGQTFGGGGWEEWYSPEERRLLVESRYRYRLALDSPRFNRPDLLAHGCVTLRSDRACLLLLERPWHVPGSLARIPLGPSTRASLVAEAMEQGGEGAFARFLAQPGAPFPDRLGSASGLHPDSLMARWRDRVLEARPELHAGLLLSPVSLAIWILILLAVASRSTRWRLG